MYRHAIAMTEEVESVLRHHLLRRDGQEDICLATYTVSSGRERTTRILQCAHLPAAGEREVHGNATIRGSYVLRVAARAARRGQGVALIHSHPDGSGWQDLSDLDHDAESSFAGLVEQVTGLPLVGLTLAGDLTWSARVWIDQDPESAGSVRCVGDGLRLSFNDELVPAEESTPAQLRTVSVWGERAHRDITRIRALVVGPGSVGLDVAQRLAATGLLHVGVMDVDKVNEVNRDRMIGATRRDAKVRRLKVSVAARLSRQASTARRFDVAEHAVSITSPEGLEIALDYDVVFSCVDRPWPRAVLNTLAYADLIPVIDGGIGIDAFDDDTLRSATRRTQVATPGRPCMACSRQISMSDVALEMNGLLDDPEYIRRSGREPLSGRPNVALLCAGVSASQLELFVSLVGRPGGLGVPKPLRFILGIHALEHLPETTQEHCQAERDIGVGNGRIDLTKPDHRAGGGDGLGRIRRWLEDTRDWFSDRLSHGSGVQG